MPITIVHPARMVVVRQLKDIDTGTVFQYGGRANTFLRTSDGVVYLETGEVAAFDEDEFHDYIEYPRARLVLNP